MSQIDFKIYLTKILHFFSPIYPFLGLRPPDRGANQLQPGLLRRKQPGLRIHRKSAHPRSDAHSGTLFRPLHQFHRRQRA
jgi:hypothetical protein